MKPFHTLLIGACLSATLPAAHAKTPASSAAKETAEVEKAFADWRSALSSGNADNVVKLYESDAMLLSTLSAEPIMTQEARRAYFTTLTAKPAMSATVDEGHIRLLDADSAVASGLYTFRFTEGGKTVEIPARYSFVFEKEGGRWMIVEHHSSRVPG